MKIRGCGSTCIYLPPLNFASNMLNASHYNHAMPPKQEASLTFLDNELPSFKV